MVRDELARRLKLFREARGLTIYEVGKKINKSGKTVSAWEQGRGQPDADMLITLCDLYEVESITQLLGSDPVPPLYDDEAALLDSYRSLNAEGKSKIREYIADLERTGIYISDRHDRGGEAAV